MESAPAIYRPTNFWNLGLSRILKDIEKKGIENFRQHPSANSFYVSSYAPIHYRNKKWITVFFKLLSRVPKLGFFVRAVLDALSGIQKALVDYRIFTYTETEKAPRLINFSQSFAGNPLESFQIDGKNYTRDSLNYLRGLVFLKQHADTGQIKTILEIGGGYGVLGEIFAKCNNRDYRYVNVDIPPLSYVSTWYLEQALGKENVLNYAESRAMTEIDLNILFQKYKAIVLCPWQLPKVKGEVDLFVNFMSFQEMEPPVVKNYSEIIRNLVRGYLLLRNSRSGRQIAKKVGELGVLQQTQTKDYIRYFEDFELVASDSCLYGNQTAEEVAGKLEIVYESLAMVFKRKNN